MAPITLALVPQGGRGARVTCRS